MAFTPVKRFSGFTEYKTIKTTGNLLRRARKGSQDCRGRVASLDSVALSSHPGEEKVDYGAAGGGDERGRSR